MKGHIFARKFSAKVSKLHNSGGTSEWPPMGSPGVPAGTEQLAATRLQSVVTSNLPVQNIEQYIKTDRRVGEWAMFRDTPE